MVEEILRHIRSYLDGTFSRVEFENWFLPATWNLSEEQDPVAHDLSAQVYLALAEFDNGDLDEAELKERLAEVVSSAPPSKAGTRRLS
jgi:hypothetical protein